MSLFQNIFISEFRMPPKPGKTRLSSLKKKTEFLGSPKMLLENDLPTARGCLRYAMLLKEEAELKDEELDVNNMARGVSKKLASLYFKANAKL